MIITTTKTAFRGFARIRTARFAGTRSSNAVA